MSHTTGHFLLSQIDSWFFRESRSMDGSGSTVLESVFPPSNATLLGALRTQIGNAYHQKHGSDWKSFNGGDGLAKIIGYGSDYANLESTGGWLYHTEEQQLYFPVTRNVLRQGNDGFGFFQLGDVVHCDLGRVQLPQLSYQQQQSPIEEGLISSQQLERVLQGQQITEMKQAADIITADTRLGIARDNHTRRTQDGMLYQTSHIRMASEWSIYIGLTGDFADYLPQQKVQRLGGEARMTALTTLAESPKIPAPPSVPANAKMLMLYLITPLPDVRQDDGMPMLPSGDFKVVESQGQTTWQGELLGHTVEVVSAMTGNVERVGGWDMAKHQSLPVRSFIPAGSCWVIRVHDDGQAPALVDALHGKFLTTGRDRAQGYGQILMGLCPSQMN